MAQVQIHQTVNATVDEVWKSWDRFGDIYQFNPNLRASYLINGSSPSGLGAERQCDMKDGKNYIRERVTAYVPNERLEIDIYEGTLPMRDTRVRFDFDPRGDNATDVTMTIAFTPAMGLLSPLMAPLMKLQMRKLLGRLLEGNAAFVERGERVAA